MYSKSVNISTYIKYFAPLAGLHKQLHEHRTDTDSRKSNYDVYILAIQRKVARGFISVHLFS